MSAAQLNVTEPQARFHMMVCKHPAFVAGFGSGKSETMANQAIMDARAGGSECLIGLYEPTYDLVKLIMAPRMESRLTELGVRYRWNKSDNIIYTSSGGFGDFVLRTMDNPSRIIGYETMTAHVDELDTLAKEKALEVWHKVIARNRQSPATYLPAKRGDGSRVPMNRVSAYSTPEGFRLMYELWGKDLDASRAKGYHMIQAATASNPYLPPDYIETLRNIYPKNLIDAYLEGRFVNMASGTIYTSFDRKLNNSFETIQKGETLIVGQDFNVGKMASVIYVQRVRREYDAVQTGKYWDVEELHAVAEIKDGMDTPDVIQRLIGLYQQPDDYHPIAIYPDASGANRKSTNASVSDISLLEEAGFAVYTDASNPAVKDRIMAVNGLLCNGKGVRRLFVNIAACPRLTECLEQQVWDAKTGEPDKKAGVDHMNDAAGYPVWQLYPIVRPVADAISISLY